MDYVVPREFAPLFWWAEKTSPDYRYYDFSGGRSSGKSTTVALALALEGAVHPIRVFCVREIQKSIEESSKKLLETVIRDNGLDGYHVTKTGIAHDNGTEFLFSGLHEHTAEAGVKSIEGIDRCWVEEAQTITAASLDILLPTIRKDDSTVIFTRNPRTPDDVITQRFVTRPSPMLQKRTYHAHVTWEALSRAGVLPREVLAQIEEAKTQPDYAHIWLGEPTLNTVNAIISRDAITQALTRPPTSGPTILGVDVARYGTDRTAVAVNRGGTLTDLITWTGASITDSARRVATIATQHQPLTAIHVDDTGVGGGLTDCLKDMGLPVEGVNFAAKASDPLKWPNIASELWFHFADILPTISINPDLTHRTELITELTSREWQINARNQREISSKQKFKNDGHRSPDLADAVLLAYYCPPQLTTWNVEV